LIHNVFFKFVKAFLYNLILKQIHIWNMSMQNLPPKILALQTQMEQET